MLNFSFWLEFCTDWLFLWQSGKIRTGGSRADNRSGEVRYGLWQPSLDNIRWYESWRVAMHAGLVERPRVKSAQYQPIAGACRTGAPNRDSLTTNRAQYRPSLKRDTSALA
jgi:hypothetical protein